MALDWKQQHVSQALDMLVGQCAEVLIRKGMRVLLAMPMGSSLVLICWCVVLQPDVEHRDAAYGKPRAEPFGYTFLVIGAHCRLGLDHLDSFYTFQRECSANGPHVLDQVLIIKSMRP
ncbi:hypothetical protein B0H10DRAFT_1214012 [Mycena sp. CBHHK59/15]|nr:hypothetical protein B0H10DRAFT_1214012 [Mycena sp. CBHHK59/15]